jgi:peptidoglycan/xylan/chitin deacetylase (PgdA/CDA1 family)
LPAESNEIYLTFDDGPMPGPTDFVLRELDEVKAKATFFCIGDNVAKYSETFHKIIQSGHQIGNHTFNHLKGWNHETSAYVSNTLRCEEQFLQSGLIHSTRLFRPPYGRIKRSQVAALSSFHIVMWDVLTFDYDAMISAERSLRSSIDATRPGSIIVFHDSIKAEKKLRQILPSFLKYFSEKGFAFKALPHG